MDTPLDMTATIEVLRKENDALRKENEVLRKENGKLKLINLFSLPPKNLNPFEELLKPQKLNVSPLEEILQKKMQDMGPTSPSFHSRGDSDAAMSSG